MEAELLTSVFAEIYLACLFLLEDYYFYRIRHPLRLNDARTATWNGRNTPTLIYENLEPVEISKNHFTII